MASKQYKGEKWEKKPEGFSFLYLGYFSPLPLFIYTFLILVESDHLLKKASFTPAVRN